MTAVAASETRDWLRISAPHRYPDQTHPPCGNCSHHHPCFFNPLAIGGPPAKLHKKPPIRSERNPGQAPSFRTTTPPQPNSSTMRKLGACPSGFAARSHHHPCFFNPLAIAVPPAKLHKKSLIRSERNPGQAPSFRTTTPPQPNSSTMRKLGACPSGFAARSHHHPCFFNPLAIAVPPAKLHKKSLIRSERNPGQAPSFRTATPPQPNSSTMRKLGACPSGFAAQSHHHPCFFNPLATAVPPAKLHKKSPIRSERNPGQAPSFRTTTPPQPNSSTMRKLGACPSGFAARSNQHPGFSTLSIKNVARTLVSAASRLISTLLLLLTTTLQAQERITFTKTFPNSVPPYCSVQVTKDGAMEYKETPAEDKPLQAKLSQTETDTLFDLAAKLDHFKNNLESGLKVAFTGKKTFRYESAAGEKTETVFNYSLDPTAQQLWDRFEQIAESERAYLDLDRAIHFDKLGVNDALAQIEQLWLNKQLSAPQQFIPLLTRVANHEAFMHLARERAARLKDEFLAAK